MSNSLLPIWDLRDSSSYFSSKTGNMLANVSFMRFIDSGGRSRSSALSNNEAKLPASEGLDRMQAIHRSLREFIMGGAGGVGAGLALGLPKVNPPAYTSPSNAPFSQSEHVPLNAPFYTPESNSQNLVMP